MTRYVSERNTALQQRDNRVLDLKFPVSVITMSVMCASLLLRAWPTYAEAEPPSSGPNPWQYGGLVDISYGLNFNFPENHQWRSKETTPRTNELAPNMALGYLHKEPHRAGEWGMELAGQAGYDTDALVPNEQEGRGRPVPGADVLRHLSRANVSYLAPIGNGLMLTAGLMQGYINYESFYAKHNFNYTRAYITDYSPNFVFGLGSRYAITHNVDVGFHVMNGFQFLAHANNLPSYGAELDWRVARRVVLAQNVYYGPDQADTSLRFWRFFSDTQVRWTGDEVTVALSYDIGTERATDLPNHERTFWTGAALFTRWDISGPWSVSVRPEWFWDRNGRMTDSRQLIWAVTTTLGYQRHIGRQLWVSRLEYRYDDSTGKEGGFFKDGDVVPGVPRLVSSQHLLLFSLLWAFDS
ncbi:MAG TPA: outer membrane beta-barrel protein [Nitrospiraceae bacterium]|nr:outer membrane beta-barrel protein [Nitrospiraceae bacterium]